MNIEIAAVPAEFKFVDAAGVDIGPGEFKGYGAVFGNLDSHDDVIEPGAFAETLALRKSQGRSGPPMHVMHGLAGDGLPVGVWKTVDEDDKGLRVHGKISGMSTEFGKLLYERLRDGALAGLSIGYRVAANGAEKRDGKRFLKRLYLGEISLVDDPSNALAKVDEMKRAQLRETKTILQLPHAEDAATAIKACLDLHAACLGDTDSPTEDERAAMRKHLEVALGHLGGVPSRKARADGADLAEAFAFVRDFKI